MGSNAHIRPVAAPIPEPSGITNARLYGYRASRLDAILDSMSSVPPPEPPRSDRRRAALAALVWMGRWGTAVFLGALYGGRVPDDRNGERKDDRLRYLPDSRR
jgi:hypothetical protein